MNTEEIFKQSGYTIPTDKHDECSKRFDYWDMIAFADLVIEKLKEQDSNLSQHLVSGSKQMIEALDELVQVKEYKDKHGKDEQYETAKEQAWKNAKDLLNTYYR